MFLSSIGNTISNAVHDVSNAVHDVSQDVHQDVSAVSNTVSHTAGQVSKEITVGGVAWETTKWVFKKSASKIGASVFSPVKKYAGNQIKEKIGNPLKDKLTDLKDKLTDLKDKFTSREKALEEDASDIESEGEDIFYDASSNVEEDFNEYLGRAYNFTEDELSEAGDVFYDASSEAIGAYEDFLSSLNSSVNQTIHLGFEAPEEVVEYTPELEDLLESNGVLSSTDIKLINQAAEDVKSDISQVVDDVETELKASGAEFEEEYGGNEVFEALEPGLEIGSEELAELGVEGTVDVLVDASIDLAFDVAVVAVVAE
jgi:gas vesicle protein